ncbi:MAG: DNA-directed RNA polymerase subunit delta [Erysipelotrichaceae bacterium]|nr:DNA-directed RNA polymerase subunit delta [Erysipelotrichaceae bacterium]
MSDKSLLDLAYDYVEKSKGSVTFKALWKAVCKAKGYDEETANKKVSQFYTTLLLDGRFVTLGENKWDLRSRHTFDKVHIDMKDVYSDVEASDSDDVEEEVEEKEYNEVFEEKVIDRNDEIEADVSEDDESEEDK